MFVNPTSVTVTLFRPFAETLNVSAFDNANERKKSAYAQSGIGITNKLPSFPIEFGFAEVETHSVAFAKDAVKIWSIV